MGRNYCSWANVATLAVVMREVASQVIQLVTCNILHGKQTCMHTRQLTNAATADKVKHLV